MKIFYLVMLWSLFLALCLSIVGCVADEISTCARACESEKREMQSYTGGNSWSHLPIICQCGDKK